MMSKRGLETSSLGNLSRPNKRLYKPDTGNPFINHNKEEEQQLLKTINKKNLNFDLEKICCVTLLQIGIYCCLTCGKFYQGRSGSSEAYKHSIEFNDHKLYINLDTLKIYSLPENIEFTGDNYQIIKDIRNAIDPRYTESKICEINVGKTSFDLVNHKEFKVGFIGLNNFPSYQLVILHMLAHIDQVKDFFLLNKESSIQRKQYSKGQLSSLLVGKFIRKYWFDQPLHSILSPFELLNHVNRVVAKMEEDPKVFLTWLLNNVSDSLSNTKNKKKTSNVLTKNLQGKIKISLFSDNSVNSVNESTSKFWYLSLPLPDKDIINYNNTNQVSLNQLLTTKFDHPTIVDEYSFKKYEVTKFPETLILHFERFGKDINNVNDITFNDMIVKFHSELLDFGAYFGKDIKYSLISNVVVSQRTNDSSAGGTTKSAIDTETKEEKHNISDSRGSISWKIQLLDPSQNQWYEIDHLSVRKINNNLLFLNDSYIQVYKKISSSNS